jgi:hypothetical protein
MKKGEAKIGTAVKVTNLDYMVGVAISSQMNEIRKVGVYGVITAFVPGYNRNVCLVRQIGSIKVGMFSYIELKRINIPTGSIEELK